MWLDTITQNLQEPQIVNDSKTPSGRVHVGSLRGVLIHDAIFRELQSLQIPASYTYGIDDYDPMDDLPTEATEELRQYLGQPLCNIPPPEGSSASDMADHYITEFLELFPKLGVKATTYRMRDIYRSGRFNAAIEAILSKADLIREIYLKVSHSQRPATWHPFQTICEKCGCIGTTEVSAFDGQEVTYHCRPDLVSWAKGCDYRGKVSPYDGNGKLPWKLEWAAKWATFGITIEGAGKDHCTKGGSRDVAAATFRALFKGNVPQNIPYEFFLVQGAKMSSSKGIGTAARDMADFLPPEILRHLMIGVPPKKTVDFNTSLPNMVKLFNDYDRHLIKNRDGTADTLTQRLLAMAKTTPSSIQYQPIPFQLISTLIQLPHIHLTHEVARRTPIPLTEADHWHLEQRVGAAKFWLTHFATPEETFTIQETLPTQTKNLSATQVAFLHILQAKLADLTEPHEDVVQSLIFDCARITPIPQKQAFDAIYLTFLAKESGPKAGSLLAFLEKNFVAKRLLEIPLNKIRFMEESSISKEAFFLWMEKNDTEVTSISLDGEFLPSPSKGQNYTGWVTCTFLFKEKKQIMRIHAFSVSEQEMSANTAQTRLNDFIHELAQKLLLSRT
ncbi:MAG: lysine--tRNA ligase [Magnetococcus sp. DMHC-6]